MLGDIATADPQALDELGTILRDMYNEIALPTQTLLNLVAALPNKGRHETHRYHRFRRSPAGGGRGPFGGLRLGPQSRPTQ